MYEPSTIVYSFNPNQPLRRITNIMRAQVAGKGIEKDFVLNSLATKEKLDATENSFVAALEMIMTPSDLAQVIPALVYLDGSGYGDEALNELLVKGKKFPTEEPVGYSLNLAHVTTD